MHLDGTVLGGLPIMQTVDLVQSNHKRSAVSLDQLNGLDGLVLKAVHKIDHKNGEIAERRATRAATLM